MGIQSLVIILGYCSELLESLVLKFLFLSIASILHFFIVCFLCIVCVLLKKKRNLSQQHTKEVLNQGVVEFLGFFILIIWLVFPFLFFLTASGILSDELYLLSSPAFDVFSKGAFVSVLNSIYFKEDLNLQGNVNSEMSSMFVRFLNHEIMNPFNLMMLGLDHLDNEQNLSEYKSLINTLRQSAHSMKNVISDVLELCEAQQGVKVQSTPIQLKEILAASISAYMERAQKKGITIEHQISENFPETVLGDSSKIRIVFSSLISNAVKFSPPNSVVRVTLYSYSVTRSTFSIIFAVEDNGIGVPQAMTQNLFEPFARLRCGDFCESEEGATGLSLCYAKKLCDAMGAEISFTPNTPTGSIFKIICAFNECASGQTKCQNETCSTDSSIKLSVNSSLHSYKASSLPIPPLVRKYSSQHLKIVPESGKGEYRAQHESHNFPNEQPFAKSQTESDYNFLSNSVQPNAGMHKDKAVTVKDGLIRHVSTEVLNSSFPRNEKPNMQRVHRKSRTAEVYTNKYSQSGSFFFQDDEGLPPRINSLSDLRENSFEELLEHDSNKRVKQNQSDQSYFGILRKPKLNERDCEDGVRFHSLHSKDILIVDDMKSNTKLALLILEKEGYSCDVAMNGLEAVQLSFKTQYQLVIMDRTMPVMDGIEATRQILRFDHNVTIIGLTGNISEQEVQEFVQAGAKEVVKKPATRAELVRLCNLYIRSR